jgi:Ca2+-binding RTX toxin-like protein
MTLKHAVASAFATGLLLHGASAAAAVRSFYTPQPSFPQGTLRVESDADDPIVVACVGGRVEVNGEPPGTGPLECWRANRIEAIGGPGANRIDLGGIAPAQALGVGRGVAAFAVAAGGAGDDVIQGASGGFSLIVGGSGNDWLQGHARAINSYVFDAAETPERDTIVDPPTGRCDPSYFDSNRGGTSYWTVPWDALDFRSLRADDPVAVDTRALSGIVASHRNRLVFAAGGLGIGVQAVAGGAGDDRIGFVCMAVGGDGDDMLAGTGTEGDLLLGGSGRDQLAGGGGPDHLNGGGGADELNGDAGEDALVGAGSNDVLRGGADGDVYLWTSSDGVQTDSVVETATRGGDTLFFGLAATTPVAVDLASRSGIIARANDLEVRASLETARLLEGIVGGRGNDRLLGNDRRNMFWSGGGTDLAVGRRGNDTYYVDWTATMPYGAYAWGEFWAGPFERVETGWPQFGPIPRSYLRVHETRGGGFDTVDLAHGDAGINRGVRADLNARRWVVRAGKLGLLSARDGGARNLEGLRGTDFRDTLIGNAAGNLLEGRSGLDRVLGGPGRDVCIRRDGDFFRSCERIVRSRG